MRYNYTTLAAVKRSTAYSSDKSTMALTGNSYYGYFAPRAETRGQNSGQAIDQQWMFTTDGTADIKDGDKLNINLIDYTVKGCARYMQLGQEILAVTCFKEVD